MTAFEHLPIALASLVVLLARPAILACRPFVAIGRISYGLYLWHFPLSDTFGPIGMLAAFPIAAASLVLVERPIRETVRSRLRRTLFAPGHPESRPGDGADGLKGTTE